MKTSKDLDCLTEESCNISFVSRIKKRIKSGLAYALIGSTLLLGSGCATYVGYNEVSGVKVLDSRPVQNSQKDVKANAVENLEVELRTLKLKEHVYYEYHGGLKVLEIVLYPFAHVFLGPEIDLFIRLFGGRGPFLDAKFFEADADNPPDYFTNLSQNILIGMLNPFQCVLYNKRRAKSKYLELVKGETKWVNAKDVLNGVLAETLANSKNYEKASANFAIGSIYARAGLLKRATEEYKKAVAIDVSFLHQAYADLGVVYLDKGEYAQAMAGFGEALSHLYKWKGDGAIDELENLVEVNPEDLGSRFCLAFVYEREGSEDDAIEEFEKIIEIKDSPLARYALGNVCKKEDMDNRAKKHFRNAIKLDPSFMPARLNLAVCHDEAGEYDKAIKQFTIIANVHTAELIDYLKKQNEK